MFDKKSFKVLIVDDEESIRDVLQELMVAGGYTAESAISAEEALEKIQQSHFHLILSDIRMSGMSGIDLLRQIKTQTHGTEVVIITSHASVETAVQALQLGAYDYVLKPFENLEIVFALVHRAFDKTRLMAENQSLLEDLQRKNKELEKLNLSIRELAIRDGLTGLYNYRYFHEVLRNEIERSKRHTRSLCLVMFDVDHFKNYNDMNGHLMGDEVLLGIGRLLCGRARSTDLVGRYGGEEFVIILPETSREQAMRVAEEVRKEIESHPFKNGESQPLGKVSVSGGIAMYPDDANDSRKLIEYADQALYFSKSQGRNCIHPYNAIPSDAKTSERS